MFSECIKANFTFGMLCYCVDYSVHQSITTYNKSEAFYSILDVLICIPFGSLSVLNGEEE